MKELQGVPVAVLSSSPTDVIQDRLTQAGVKADGHFEKPMDIDGLFVLAKELRGWFEKARAAASGSR